jgi:hypothetical protein
MIDDIGPGYPRTRDWQFRGLCQVPKGPARGRDPSIVLRSRGVAYAPIPAVRMLWVAPGGVTETPGFGRDNFGGSLPKSGLEGRRQVVLM